VVSCDETKWYFFTRPLDCIFTSRDMIYQISLDGSLIYVLAVDGPQPHDVNIQFDKKKEWQSWSFDYVDYKLDESYTFSKYALEAGTCLDDLQDVQTLEFTEPTGWLDFLRWKMKRSRPI
jgi:hypothetical protein